MLRQLVYMGVQGGGSLIVKWNNSVELAYLKS